MGTAVVNGDGAIGNAWSGDGRFAPRNFDSLLTALLTGTGSLKPWGDMTVLQKAVYHGRPGISAGRRSDQNVLACRIELERRDCWAENVPI